MSAADTNSCSADPPVDEIKRRAGTINRLAINSQEFAVLLRKLAPRIVVFPYRLCDGRGGSVAR